MNIWADVLDKNVHFYHAVEGTDGKDIAKDSGMKFFNNNWAFTDIDKSIENSAKFPFIKANPPEAEILWNKLKGHKYSYKIVSVNDKIRNVILKEFPKLYKKYKDARDALKDISLYHSKGNDALKPDLRIKIVFE